MPRPEALYRGIYQHHTYMEITDIKLDKKYLHPKHGPGEIIAARQDDGAALIFQPFDSKGDTGDWNDPLYQVEAWELIEFTQEQWDQRYR